MALLSRNKGQSKIQRASAEERLLDYAKGLKKFRKGRRAVLVRMSALTRMFDERRYRSAAMKNFAPLMQDFEGVLVELSNNDIVCGLNGATYANMDSVVLKIRIMFRDDENLKAAEDQDEDIFVQWWDIEKDFDNFLEFSKERYNQARMAEMEQDAAEDQGKTLGDKIFSLSGKNDSFNAGDALRNRFAGLGKSEPKEAAPEKSGLASRFANLNKSSGLEGLGSRLSGSPKPAPAAEAPKAAPQSSLAQRMSGAMGTPLAEKSAPVQNNQTANAQATQAPTQTTAQTTAQASPAIGNMARPAAPAAKPAPQQPLATDFSYQNKKTDEDDRPPGIHRDIRYVEITPPKKQIEIRPVSAMDLEKIETAILAADLSTMVSREDIRLVTNNKVQTVFSDRIVPIPVVRQRFLPLVDISTDRWFMRHLREIVDKRTLVAALDFSDPSAIARGFRVSIDAIDSKEFITFERNTRKIKRNQLILEFSFQDIVSKVAEYLKVQDILQARGYQICIGDMDPYMFTLFNRSVIRSDFEKVRWTKEFEQEATVEWKNVFKDMVQSVGRERVILVACADSAAVKAGQDLGISLFHGSYVNTL